MKCEDCNCFYHRRQKEKKMEKQKLQTLVDEAEEMYDEAFDDKSTKYTALEMKQYHAIQALKKDHPEF